MFPPPFHHLKKSIKSSEPVRDIDLFVYIYFGRTLAVHFKVQLDSLSLQLCILTAVPINWPFLVRK